MASAEKVGNTLVYVLRADQRPRNPDQQWYGRINTILLDLSTRRRYYLVQSREFPDCEELIYPEQVRGFGPPL